MKKQKKSDLNASLFPIFSYMKENSNLFPSLTPDNVNKASKNANQNFTPDRNQEFQILHFFFDPIMNLQNDNSYIQVFFEKFLPYYNDIANKPVINVNEILAFPSFLFLLFRKVEPITQELINIFSKLFPFYLKNCPKGNIDTFIKEIKSLLAINENSSKVFLGFICTYFIDECLNSFTDADLKIFDSFFLFLESQIATKFVNLQQILTRISLPLFNFASNLLSQNHNKQEHKIFFHRLFSEISQFIQVDLEKFPNEVYSQLKILINKISSNEPISVLPSFPVVSSFEFSKICSNLSLKFPDSNISYFQSSNSSTIDLDKLLPSSQKGELLNPTVQFFKEFCLVIIKTSK